MVIRTITCHHAYNHGAMLQAFALVKYLQSLGHDVSVIDYWPQYMSKYNVDFKSVPQKYDYIGLRQLYRYLKKSYHQLEQLRRDSFESFFSKYIPITSAAYNSIDDLRRNPPDADLYIAGSDQIWNTTFNNGNDPAFYLSFGSPKRKVSYAASFATSELKNGTQTFVQEQLKNFDSISVREQSGLEILDELGYQGVVVADPIFLLGTNQWDEMLSNEITQGDDYILAYDFEPRNGPVGLISKRLATLMGCKIFSVSPFKHRYADRAFVDCSPDIFVSLIKNARCIVSNSFHGTAFSMLYGRNFFVVNRKDGLNIRMKDLLSRYKLNDRLVSLGVADESLVKNVDYNSVNKLLKNDVDFSKSFLSQQLELAK